MTVVVGSQQYTEYPLAHPPVGLPGEESTPPRFRQEVRLMTFAKTTPGGHVEVNAYLNIVLCEV